MIELIKIIVLAVVQGIAEFLPISSSGHLAVIHSVFDFLFHLDLDATALDSITVDVILHLGTLLAIVVYYFKTLLNILLRLQYKLVFLLIIATIPAGISGLLLDEYCEGLMSNLWLIGCLFLLTAFLLIASQKYAQKRQNNYSSDDINTNDINTELQSITWVQALVIGLFQAVAVLPGLSRSGSTIAGGLFSGVKQSAAANFSFLLAIPVIGGAGLLKVVKLIKNPPENLPVMEISLGFLLSFIVGIIALYWVIGWIKQGKLSWFTWWLVGAAGFTFVLAAI